VNDPAFRVNDPAFRVNDPVAAIEPHFSRSTRST